MESKALDLISSASMHYVNGWMDELMSGWMDGWMDGGISRWMSGQSLGFGEGLLGFGPHSPVSQVVFSKSLHLYAL